MFRKRLALFLSLAMFVTSIPMFPVNVLAEEEVVVVSEEDQASENNSDGAEKVEEASEEATTESLEDRVTKEAEEEEAPDKNLEDVDLPDSKDESEADISDKEDKLITKENENLSEGETNDLKEYDIQLDGLTKAGFVHVFKDEIRDISVVSDIFYDYNDVQVKWQLYAVDRETGGDGYALFEYWQEGSATDYVLNGAEVEHYTDWNSSIIRMHVIVCKDDHVFASEEFTIDYYEKESHYYEDTQEVAMIPGGEKIIRGQIGGYVRDQDHPDGESVYCKVTDVTITNSDDTMTSDVCSVYQENNDFRIVAENIGSAEARVTYYDYYGQECSYNFTIHVDSDVVYLDINYPTNTVCMMPHETRKITTSLRHEWHNSDGESGSEMIDDYRINLTLDEDGNPAYNQDLMDVSLLEDGKTLEVESKDHLGESDIFLNTEIQIDKGNEKVPLSTTKKVHVNIVDRYFYHEDFDYNANAKVGENINICPTIKSVRTENGEVLTEDFNGVTWFDMDYNNDEFAVTEIEGGIAITRKVDYKTRMFIRCMVRSEQDTYEVFGKWIDFNEVDHEWVITYEWSADFSKCDAKANCKHDSEAQHESVISKKTVKAPAKCKTDEIISYSASFQNALFATQTKELEGNKALGHAYVNNKCSRCSIYESLKAPSLKKAENDISGVKITWNSVQNAKKYNIYRKLGTGQWVKIGSSNTTTYIDKKAALGKKYSYTVCCVANDGSNKIISSYNTKGLTITRLATITPSLKNSRTAIKIKWKKVAGAKGYVIYRKVGSGKFKKLTTIKKVGTVSYSDKKVKKGKTYTYYVYAYTGKDTGAYVKKSLKKKK